MSSPRTSLRSVLCQRLVLEGAGGPGIFSIPEPMEELEIFQSPTAYIEGQPGIFISPGAYMGGARSNVRTYSRHIS